jgi:hypothetical protein
LHLPHINDRCRPSKEAIIKSSTYKSRCDLRCRGRIPITACPIVMFPNIPWFPKDLYYFHRMLSLCHTLLSTFWIEKIIGVSRHFQQYFSYIVAISFIGGWNRRTRRKPPTSRKSLEDFIT